MITIVNMHQALFLVLVILVDVLDTFTDLIITTIL